MARWPRWSFLLLLATFWEGGYCEEDVDEDEDDEDLESVHVLKDGTFDSFLKSNERVLVEFYAPWCGHCQKLEPEYNQAADSLRMEDAKTVLAKVDATSETALAEKYEVKSYPTLKYFVQGVPTDYDGPRDAEGIAEWLRKRERPAVAEIEAAAEPGFAAALGDAYGAVAHVKKKSARAKAFFKAAESLVDHKGSKLRFAAVWLPKDADPKKDAHMAMYRPGDSRIDFTGTWTDGAIAKWVKQGTYAKIGTEFKAEKYGAEAVQELGFKGSVVGIFGDDNLTLLELFEKVAAVETSWKFTVVPKSSLGDLETQAVKEVPQVRVLHGEKKYVLHELKEAAVKKLLADILAKKAKPYYKSAEAPREATEDGVTVLTGDLFEEVALNSKKDVFVEFYAPWCGHCQKLAPVWSQLAKSLEQRGFDKKGVVVAKMDVTENECEEQIGGYPTLILYPAVKQEKKMRSKLIYSGARDFDPLMDFILENSVNLEDVDAEVGLGKQASLVDRERKKKKEL